MKDLNLIILNQELKPLGILEPFTSLIWQESYYDIGTFEVYLPYSSQTYELINVGTFIMRDDTNQVAYIESRIQKNNSGSAMLIISGYMLEGILQKRISSLDSFLPGTALVLSGSLEGMITQPLRSLLPQVDVKILNTSGNPLLWGDDITPNQLISYYSSILYRVLADQSCSIKNYLLEYGKIIFELYSGEDHTLEQKDRVPILISEKMGNAINSEYQDSEAGCKDIVIVVGAYPQDSYKLDSSGQHIRIPKGEYYSYVYNPKNYGIDDLRINHIGIVREMIMKESTMNAGNVSQVVYIPDYEKSEEYFAQEAKAQMVPYSQENFVAQLSDSSIVKIGDIVTFRDEARGVDYNRRVEKYVESYNANQIIYSTTLGSSLKTTKDIIRKSLGIR